MTAYFKTRFWASILALAAPACDSGSREIAPDDLQRRSALLTEVRKTVQHMENADAAQALTGLEHRDPRVRERAAKRLAELETVPPQTVDALIGALKDPSKRVRVAAAAALGRLRDPRAIEPLLFALADSDPAVRLWAGKAIRLFGDDGISALIRCMAFDSPYVDVSYKNLAGEKIPVRRIAKDLLTAIGKPAVPLLIQALEKETNEGILHNVPGVLGKLGAEAKDALPALIAALKTPDAEMRVNIVSDIGKIGDLHPDVVVTLENAVMDTDTEVAAAARQALRAVKKGAPKSRPSAVPDYMED